MVLPTDSVIESRKKQHERWHMNCKKHKRNTKEGIVEWKVRVQN